MKKFAGPVIGVLCGVVIGLAVVYFLSVGGALIFILALVVVCFGIVLLNKFFARTGMMALYQRCDPTAAIRSQLRKLEKAERKHKVTAAKYYRLNLAAACHANGETERALRLLHDMTPEGEKPAFAVLYYADIAAMNWDMDALSEAFTEAWRKAGDLTADLRQKGKLNKQIDFFISYLGTLTDITNHDYARALEWFEHTQVRLPRYNLYFKVTFTYHIACLYERLGYPENSCEGFNFVIARGNKLNVVRLAREDLSAL